MQTLHLFPNQHAIQIKKTDPDKTFIMLNSNTLQNAAINLSAAAFKLWVYFAQNKNDFIFALSPQAIQNTFGMKEKQYRNALKELIKKHYIVQENIQKYNITGYIFYDNPTLPF